MPLGITGSCRTCFRHVLVILIDAVHTDRGRKDFIFVGTFFFLCSVMIIIQS